MIKIIRMTRMRIIVIIDDDDDDGDDDGDGDGDSCGDNIKNVTMIVWSSLRLPIPPTMIVYIYIYSIWLVL